MSTTKTTITEALAEIATIDRRIKKKREFILAHLYRQRKLIDPLEKDGGSPRVLKQEMQSVKDLEERKVNLRAAIATANACNEITVAGTTRTIADWLVWRREVAPAKAQALQQLANHLNSLRDEARRKGVAISSAGAAAEPDDIIVHVNEKALQDDIDNLEEIIGNLDGQLSLKNALTQISVPL